MSSSRCNEMFADEDDLGKVASPSTDDADRASNDEWFLMAKRRQEALTGLRQLCQHEFSADKAVITLENFAGFFSREASPLLKKPHFSIPLTSLSLPVGCTESLLSIVRLPIDWHIVTVQLC